MKTLLIPTDFNVKSLNCIPSLLQKHYPHKVNVILVHLMKITGNTEELRMLSKRSAEQQHISAEFYEACATLKRQHAEMLDIRMEFFYGSTLAVFKQFLEANEVNSIVMLTNYPYAMLNKNSIEPALLVNRSGLNIIEVNYADATSTQLGRFAKEQSKYSAESKSAVAPQKNAMFYIL